jgi:O-antigen ligase
MQITVQRQSSLYRPQALILVVLLGVVFWTLFSGNTQGLALVVVSIMFIYGITRPVWAMGAFIISQMTIPGFMAGPLSLRLLLLLLIGLVVLRMYIQDGIQLGNKAKRVIIPVAILVVISIVSNVFNSSFDFVFKDFRNMAVGILIVIFLPVIIRNTKDLKVLGGIVLTGMTISAIIAIVQHYGIINLPINTARANGISENELELAYLLCVVFLGILGILISEGIKKNNRILFISALLMLPALYFTYTRSAQMALVFGVVTFILFLKTRISSTIILVFILALTLYLSMSGFTDNFSFTERSQIGQESSSISRKILWQAGIAIAKDNPVLGIGGDQYIIVAPQYEEAVDPALIQWEEDRYWSYRTLGSVGIHNDFLNMWVSYGALALLAFIWIMAAVLRNLIDSYRMSNQRFIKGLAVGLAAGLIAYAVNAFYHNLIAEFPLVWIVAGFSVALAKITAEDKGQANLA